MRKIQTHLTPALLSSGDLLDAFVLERFPQSRRRHRDDRSGWGTVTTPGGASVTVPAGTVSSTTAFTVTESTSTIPANIGQAVGPVYRFGPSGVTFNPPVLIVLPFSKSRLTQGTDKFRDLAVFTAPNGSTSYTSHGKAQVSGTTAMAQT